MLLSAEKQTSHNAVMWTHFRMTIFLYSPFSLQYLTWLVFNLFFFFFKLLSPLLQAAQHADESAQSVRSTTLKKLQNLVQAKKGQSDNNSESLFCSIPCLLHFIHTFLSIMQTCWVTTILCYHASVWVKEQRRNPLKLQSRHRSRSNR